MPGEFSVGYSFWLNCHDNTSWTRFRQLADGLFHIVDD